MTIQTRYFRNTNTTVNGLNCYELDIAQSGVSKTLSSGTTGYFSACDVGIRVWKRDASGAESEITSGAPVAIVTTGDGDFHVEYNNTWLCPVTALVLTDSIVVRVYRKFSIQAWTLISTALFTTEQLGASQLDNVTWTVYYILSETAVLIPAKSSVTFSFDGADNSRITNFQFTPASARNRQMLGDGLTFIIG